MRSNLEDVKTFEGVFESGRFGTSKKVLSESYNVGSKPPAALFLDPDGVDRDVTLPIAEEGRFVHIFNSGTSGNLAVKTHLGVTLATLAPTLGVMLIGGPAGWGVLTGSSGLISFPHFTDTDPASTISLFGGNHQVYGNFDVDDNDSVGGGSIGLLVNHKLKAGHVDGAASVQIVTQLTELPGSVSNAFFVTNNNLFVHAGVNLAAFSGLVLEAGADAVLSSAGFTGTLCAREFAVGASGLSTPAVKLGILIDDMGVTSDTVFGSVWDARICISSLGGVGAKVQILLSDTAGRHPFPADGSGVLLRIQSTATPTLATGISLLGATITGNAWESTGYSVDGDGDFIAKSGRLANNNFLFGRNAANSANVQAIGVNNLNSVIVGDAAQLLALQGTTIFCAQNFKPLTDNAFFLGDDTTFRWAGLNFTTAGIINFGTDTTLARASAGNLSVEGNLLYRAGGTDVPVTDGGTGASNAAGARTNLGLVIGTDVQAWDADLDALAALTGTNTIYYRSGDGTWSPVSIGANLTFMGGTLAASGGGGGSTLADGDYGDVVVSGTGTVMTVDVNVISNTKLRDSAALSVIGRSANSVGDPADIAAGTDGHVLRRAGTALGFGLLAAGAFSTGPGIITPAMLDNGAAVSVLGRSANTAGARADIAAGADDQVLRRTASALSFGQLTVGMAPDNVWTYAKIQDVSATDRILGRQTAGAGDIEEIICTAAGRALLDDANSAAQRTTLGLVIGTDVQAFDADLTALAALSGTNTIYYRSAANTWSAVTIGSGLTFSGGTLESTGGGAQLGTSQNLSGVSNVLFSSLPSTLKRIVITLNDVSIAGTTNIWVRLGDSGGLSTNDYISNAASITGTNATALSSSTSAFQIPFDVATEEVFGHLTLTLMPGNTWVASGVFARGSADVVVVSGQIVLNGVLDRIRIEHSGGGAGNFDAGNVNLLYE